MKLLKFIIIAALTLIATTGCITSNKPLITPSNVYNGFPDMMTIAFDNSHSGFKGYHVIRKGMFYNAYSLTSEREMANLKNQPSLTFALYKVDETNWILMKYEKSENPDHPDYQYGLITYLADGSFKYSEPQGEAIMKKIKLVFSKKNDNPFINRSAEKLKRLSQFHVHNNNYLFVTDRFILQKIEDVELLFEFVRTQWPEGNPQNHFAMEKGIVALSKTKAMRDKNKAKLAALKEIIDQELGIYHSYEELYKKNPGGINTSKTTIEEFKAQTKSEINAMLEAYPELKSLIPSWVFK